MQVSRKITIPATSNNSVNLGAAKILSIIAATGYVTVRTEGGSALAAQPGRTMPAPGNRGLGMVTFYNATSAAVTVTFYAGNEPFSDLTNAGAFVQEESSAVGGSSGPQSLATTLQLICYTTTITGTASERSGYNYGRQKQLIVTNLDPTLILKIKKQNFGNIATVFPRQSWTIFTDDQLIVLNDATGGTILFEVTQVFNLVPV